MLLHFPYQTDSEPPPFELKGSLFTLTVLHLFQLDEAAIERHLAEKIKQAPSFFDNTPVVIDLEGMVLPPEGVNFNGLYELLRKHGMAPVGVRNGSPELQATPGWLVCRCCRKVVPQGFPGNPNAPNQRWRTLESSIIRCDPVSSFMRRMAI